MIYSGNLFGLKQLWRKFNNADANTTKEQNVRNAVHQRYRTNILFAFTLFILTITLYFCWGILMNPASTPEIMKFADTLITAIVGGLVGFVTGKAVG